MSELDQLAKKVIECCNRIEVLERRVWQLPPDTVVADADATPNPLAGEVELTLSTPTAQDTVCMTREEYMRYATPNPLAEAALEMMAEHDAATATPEPRKPRECYRVMIGNQSYGTYSERGTAEDQLFDRTEIVHFREVIRDANGVEIESEEVRQLRERGDGFRRIWKDETTMRVVAEREVERLRLDAERADDEITRLRVADREMNAEVKRLRAEIARLTSRLAVYEECMDAQSKMEESQLAAWATKHGVKVRYPWWLMYADCASRCLELAGEVG